MNGAPRSLSARSEGNSHSRACANVNSSRNVFPGRVLALTLCWRRASSVK